ncbi:MAG: hypothetical protein HY019_12730 [Aquabacterium sp.]|uniref:hypothetical protein n=1 Tax=Aquabacterium sp. TaxID=1872578 RepID=UPI0025C02187|nr:hypothetical protein [Aquabacterium sp.]MBI3382863.1 hypothetical protein [Aquabacterium sp.]
MRFSQHSDLLTKVPPLQCVTKIGLTLVVGLGFLAQPFLTFIVVLLLALLSKDRNDRGLLVVIIVGALYLSLVNLTKLPESDMVNYLEVFDNAQQLDLTSYLLLNAREPLYYVSLYGLANLPNVDGRLYIFMSTFFPYFLLGSAVLRLGVALHLERRAILSLLVFLLFFGQLFSLSAHLCRQFLASSLVMVFLVDYSISGRRRWGIGLLGVMMHYSALPLLLLCFVRPLRRFSSGVSVLFHAFVLLSFYALVSKVAPLLLGVPLIGIVFNRLANGEGAQLDALDLTALIFAASMLFMSLLDLIRGGAFVPRVKGWSVLLCIVVVSVAVVLASVQPSLSEIALRYFFYLYFLLGLALAFWMARWLLVRWGVYGLALFALPLFFYKVSHGRWAYAPIQSLLFDPAWSLWAYMKSAYI